MKATVTSVENNNCTEYFKDFTWYENELPWYENEGIIDSQLCAMDFVNNADTCQGDSGGPIQVNYLFISFKRQRMKAF